MREIFKPRPGQMRELGRAFYTITDEDVGRRFIRTTECMIELGSVIGYVQRQDVGKRLYRVRCNDPAGGWIWQCESARQRDERLTGTWSRPMDAGEMSRYACVLDCQHPSHRKIITDGVLVREDADEPFSPAHRDCYENWLNRQVDAASQT